MGKRPPAPDPKPDPGPAAGGLGSVRGTARQLLREASVGRGVRALRVVNQHGGFDCPGCAWPEPHEPGSLEFCENGAKAVAAEATSRKADAKFFARHSLEDLRGRSDYWLEQQGRLTQPLIRREGGTHYEPLSWGEAFARAGGFLRGLGRPDQAAFYTSGRTSNEAAFLYQLMVRMLGTNNLPDCSNLCHESSGVGLGRVIGLGKGTVQLDDFERADAIFVIGQNPGTNHPRMLTALQKARRRGAEVVSINPLRERGLEAFTHPKEVASTLTGRSTAISTVYLQPRAGSDVAVLAGIMKHLLEAERQSPGQVVDHSFIRRHTTGYDELVADLDGTAWTEIERVSGLREADIRQASEIYIRSRATIVCWAMGLTQHPNGVDNVIACSNLLLLRGNIGRPGAGPCPVRGHSNVQGDRTMGIHHLPSSAFLDRLGETFGFEPPRVPGLDVVDTIHAMGRGEIRFFMAMGGNFLNASPDTGATQAGGRKVEMAVHVATKLNRSHLEIGREAMIWPCLGRTERDRQAGGLQRVTVEDSMSCVHASAGRNRPAGRELKSEPAIVAGLAMAALDGAGSVDWEGMVADYDRIRDAIEDVIPGFDDFNTRIEAPGGFVLRHPAAHREWTTESGRAELVPVPIPDLGLPEGRLHLFTIRSHDQYNTTIYGMDDRYRGQKGNRRVLFMNPRDLEARGLGEGAAVVIRSFAPDGTERRAEGFTVTAYDIPRGNAAAYFPEANVLVPLDSTAAGSNTPASKLIPIEVSRLAA